MAASFEQLLAASGDFDRFAADVRELFRGPTGQRVMSVLCKARHPMGFPRGATVDETLIANGQREVVAALYRLSELPPTNQPD